MSARVRGPLGLVAGLYQAQGVDQRAADPYRPPTTLVKSFVLLLECSLSRKMVHFYRAPLSPFRNPLPVLDIPYRGCGLWFESRSVEVLPGLLPPWLSQRRSFVAPLRLAYPWWCLGSFVVRFLFQTYIHKRGSTQ